MTKRQATQTKDSWKPCKDNSLVREGTGDRGKQPLSSTTKVQEQELMSYTTT